MLKVKGKIKWDYDTALAWAVFTKNMLINNNGFSLSQLVFGGTTTLPNFINNQLAAQETTIKLFKLALHVSALHTTWMAFIESESSNKLKLVICKNIPPSRNIYTINDDVYYK